MPIAAVVLDFDPNLTIGEWVMRLETIGLGVAVLAALIAAALVARRVPEAGTEDLLIVALCAVPGAVVGGRLGYVLLHVDFYRANPAAVIDPGQGSLELVLGVLGAAVTGGLAARFMLGAAGPWFHVTAIPTLVVIGLGKLAMALGGSGQGAPSGATWATAYSGAGPWGSLAPEISSHPAQLYEAAAVAVVVTVVAGLSAVGGFSRRDGLAWIVAVGLWLAARSAIATTWRDPTVAGPFRTDQLISLALLLALVVTAAFLVRRSAAAPVARSGEPSWPEPESRPPF